MINVSKFIHLVFAAVKTSLNCLDCIDRFSQSKRWHHSLCRNQPNEHEGQGPDLTVCEDNILWIYDPWPSLWLPRHRGPALLVHSGMHEAVNDSTLQFGFVSLANCVLIFMGLACPCTHQHVRALEAWERREQMTSVFLMSFILSV